MKSGRIFHPILVRREMFPEGGSVLLTGLFVLDGNGACAFVNRRFQ